MNLGFEIPESIRPQAVRVNRLMHEVNQRERDLVDAQELLSLAQARLLESRTLFTREQRIYQDMVKTAELPKGLQ